MRFKDIAEFTQWRKANNIKAPAPTQMLVFKEESKPKYSNQKVTTEEGEKFDSKLEHRRYQELQLMEKAGLISNLKRQVSLDVMVLNSLGEKVKVCGIRLDNTYTENGKVVLEDSKGFLNQFQKLKYRLFEITTGYKIRLYTAKGIWYLKD